MIEDKPQPMEIDQDVSLPREVVKRRMKDRAKKAQQRSQKLKVSPAKTPEQRIIRFGDKKQKFSALLKEHIASVKELEKDSKKKNR
jgi:hypothetical protein